MKLSKTARTKKKLATATELKKVVSACKILFDYGLISSKRADMIARNYR
jgi:hypothetical protein